MNGCKKRRSSKEEGDPRGFLVLLVRVFQTEICVIKRVRKRNSEWVKETRKEREDGSRGSSFCKCSSVSVKNLSDKMFGKKSKP